MPDRLNYNTLAPAAMKALGGVHVYLHSQADLPKNLIDLAYLRTSQINGCAYCIDMHSHDLIAQGVPVSKLLLVSAALGLHKRLNLEPSVHGGRARCLSDGARRWQCL